MRVRHTSIRARLLVLLLSVTAIVWIVVVLRSRADARRELNELFDAQLAQSAKVLLAQSSHDAAELRGAERARERFEHTLEHPYEQRLHFQIRDRDGRLLYRSSPDVPVDPPGNDGFADRVLEGVRWRVLVLTDAEAGLQIEICQRYDVRERLANAIAGNMMLPLVVALPLLALLIWLATRRGIRPLARVEEEFERRAPDDLRAVPDAEVPRELLPMIDALNGLLARLRERFEVERRFTADAAHELRTPLAALRTQAQVALAARGSAERDHALRQIVRAIDRATRLVEQLLTLARVDQESMTMETVDLAELARAFEDVSVDAPEHAYVTGNATLLATLLRNLVDNAVRYAKSEVRVVVRDKVLEVIDAGPGIPEPERERVFERFHRIARAGETGSGLGLSIVKRIAELHHARIALAEGENGRGLRVTATFP